MTAVKLRYRSVLLAPATKARLDAYLAYRREGGSGGINLHFLIHRRSARTLGGGSGSLARRTARGMPAQRAATGPHPFSKVYHSETCVRSAGCFSVTIAHRQTLRQAP